MSIFEFLQLNFNLVNNFKKTASQLSHEALSDFDFKNKYIIKKPNAAFQFETTIQHNIACSENAKIIGFEDLISALQAKPPEIQIFMRFIDGGRWDGRVYFDENNDLMGILIGEKRHENWSTPPNWDGSEEMLEKYNVQKILNSK